MDTKTIDKRLSNEKYYFGTFARDRIPKAKLKSHGALIVNTDPSSEEGEHWVAMMINEDGTGEYFDSYGLPPLQQDFITFMNKNSSSGWGYNRIILQCFECITCGHYCLIYVKLKLLGFSYCDFISLFTHDKEKNDLAIRALVKYLFKKLIKQL
jgi:hypothetical protein